MCYKLLMKVYYNIYIFYGGRCEKCYNYANRFHESNSTITTVVIANLYFIVFAL